MKMHLQNHDYGNNEILRTHCGKSNYNIYVDREEWTDDLSKVDCNECLKTHGKNMTMTRTEIMGHVITLYDSGVLKDRIAEMMNVTRNDVDDIINHRCILGR